MEVMPATYTPLTTNQTLSARDTQSRQEAINKVDFQPQLPASQYSVNSIGSTASDPSLENGSSVSQQTDLTELTSQSSPPLISQSKPQILQRIETDRRTPENKVDHDLPLASPMSLASPVTASNGTKRTASGHVKNASSYSGTPLFATASPRRGRAESISSAGSRAGELAASLKMRLGYAMTKVQNGWEHKTISELERMAPNKLPSNNRYSMSHIEVGARPLTAYPSDRNMYGQMHNISSPPSKRRSGAYTNGFHGDAIPSLQPAADIRSYSKVGNVSEARYAQIPAFGNAMSPPRTPVPPLQRPPTIRTNTQTAEAERDALQALTQLGSPHNSQYSRHHHNASQASSSQASPLRSEFFPIQKVHFARGDSDSSVESSSDGSALAARRAES